MTRSLPNIPLAAFGLALGLTVAVWPSIAAGRCETVASYYGPESGSRTANGERFTGQDMTAAHRTLPFGTRLRVTYRGKTVTVRVNDRGPFVKGRSLDLSREAARRLGMIPAGVARVCVERLN